MAALIDFGQTNIPARRLKVILEKLRKVRQNIECPKYLNLCFFFSLKCFFLYILQTPQHMDPVGHIMQHQPIIPPVQHPTGPHHPRKGKGHKNIQQIQSERLTLTEEAKLVSYKLFIGLFRFRLP